jgi:hypothetical protein
MFQPPLVLPFLYLFFQVVNDTLFAAQVEGHIQIFDLARKRHVKTLPRHIEEDLATGLTVAGGILVSVSSHQHCPGRVHVYELEGEKIDKFYKK